MIIAGVLLLRHIISLRLGIFKIYFKLFVNSFIIISSKNTFVSQ
jgi:hypothetical protein